MPQIKAGISVTRRSGERVIETIWVGALWTVGYLVVPALFTLLENPALAGRTAAELFSTVNMLGLACGLLLLLLSFANRNGQRWWLRGTVIGLMLAGHVAIEFWLIPAIEAAQGTGDFGNLHNLATTMYLIVSGLGLLLIALPVDANGSQVRTAKPQS